MRLASVPAFGQGSGEPGLGVRGLPGRYLDLGRRPAHLHQPFGIGGPQLHLGPFGPPAVVDHDPHQARGGVAYPDQARLDLQRDHGVLGLGRGRLLQRHVVSTRWSPSSALTVSGRVTSWPGSGLRRRRGDADRTALPGRDLQQRRLEAERDGQLGIAAREPDQGEPVAAGVVHDDAEPRGVPVPDPQQLGLRPQPDRSLDDRHGQVEGQIQMGGRLAHRPDPQPQPELLRGNHRHRSRPQLDGQRALGTGQQLHGAGLDAQPARRPGNLRDVPVDDGRGVADLQHDRGRYPRRGDRGLGRCGADPEPPEGGIDGFGWLGSGAATAGQAILRRFTARHQDGLNLLLALRLRSPGRRGGIGGASAAGPHRGVGVQLAVAVYVVPGQEGVAGHAELGSGLVALTALAADVLRHRRPASSRRDLRTRPVDAGRAFDRIFSHGHEFRHPYSNADRGFGACTAGAAGRRDDTSLRRCCTR